MKLVEFQQQKQLVKAAKDLFDNNETFRMMLQVAHEESPVHGAPTFTSGEHQDSCQLGFIKGYHHLLKVFEAMRTMPQKQKPIESQFNPPEE